MDRLKKFFSLIVSVIIILSFAPACSEKGDGVKVLRICNCEDYIDEDLLAEFEELYDCKIEYSTFGTLENLYNDIKITPDRYDLICPSDYMIEKMAKEGMLQKISFAKDGYYKTNVSDYIDETFSKIRWNNGADRLSDYAGCYMWGTLGLTFNPESVDPEDMKTWESLWYPKYKNRSTIKDSIRDSYFMGVAYAEREELKRLADKFLQDGNLEEYQSALTKIFNDTSENMVNSVGKGLKNLKGNIYGFEVDSGKNDVASGKITINFAWSGDAVYAMDEAETQGVELYYTVPDEGSNVWFDGWCVPKNSVNVDLAIKFIEFLSQPEVAVRNMEYIGYTSGIGGEAVFDNAVDWYGVKTLVESELSQAEYDALSEEDAEDYEVDKDGKIYEYVYADSLGTDIITRNGEGFVANLNVLDEETQMVVTEETEVFAVDLSYFFKKGAEDSNDYTIYTDTLGRQFSAQYPDENVISRCVVMNCYDEEDNARVTLMWENVKGFEFPTWAMVLITVILILVVITLVLYGLREKINFKIRFGNGENRRRKKYKVLKIEEISPMDEK